MTLKAKDAIKVISVRGTAFAAAKADGGSAATEKAPAGSYSNDLSSFVKQELAKSDRPELTAAKIVIRYYIYYSFFHSVIGQIQ